MAVDGEGIVKDWINSKGALVGQGNPIPQGAHLKPVRSPSAGAYLRLVGIGQTPEMTAEKPIARVRISATAHAVTKAASSIAATAYANVLESLMGTPEVMGSFKCLVVDNISGPIPLDDFDTSKEQFRYMVDADFYITA